MNNNHQNAASNEQQNKNASGGELPQKQVVKSKMTEAMQKVDAYRDQLNEGREKIMAEDYSSVVYQYEINDKPCAIGFRGRAKKPAFHYRFKDDERRAEHVTSWMESQKVRKERRGTKPRALQVGDVLRSSWGYDQTNIDYYMVTKLVGKQSVEIVEIGQDSEQTDYMQGRCAPDKSKVIGEPMRKVADGQTVKIYSFAWASKIEPQKVAGCEIYSTDRFSSYH